MAPGLPHGDSGETVAVAMHLGVAHPPGYPLPALLGKLFILLAGSGNPGFRIGLLSLFGAAAAAALLAAIMKRLRPGLPAFWAALLGTSGGLCLEVWNQMTLPKGCVYTISIALLAAGAYCLSGMRRRPERALPLLGLALGLALGGHYLIVVPCLVLVPAAIYPVLRREERRGRILVLALFAAVVGTSLYIYLPIRGGVAHPALRWGEPDTLARFKWLTVREQYASIERQERGRENKMLFLRFASRFGASLGLAGALAIGLGAAVALRRREWWLLALGAGGLLEAGAAAAYPKLAADALWVADPFFSAGWFMLVMLAAAGLAELQGLRLKGRSVWMWAAVLVVLAQEIRTGRDKAAKHWDYMAWDDQINILSTVRPKSLLMLEGDAYIAPLIYGLWVDGRRPDVAVMMRIFLHFDWGLRQLKELYPGLKLKSERPWAHIWLMARDIMEDNPGLSWYHALTTPEGWPFGEYATPAGLVYSISADRLDPDAPPDSRIDRAMFRYRLRNRNNPSRARQDAFHRVSFDNYAKAFFLRATLHGRAGNQEEALRHFERGGLLGSPECLLNAGLIYYQRGDFERAEKAWRKAAELGPDRAEAHANLGVIALRHHKRPMEAVEHCERAIRADPKLAKSYEVLAGAWLVAGSPDRAFAALKAGLASASDKKRLRRLAELVAEAQRKAKTESGKP